MDEALAERCIRIARYMLEKRATVRQASRVFGISKSSVHKDMNVRLKELDTALWREVSCLLRYNKSVRHLRGGAATRAKYLSEKMQS